MQTIQATVNRSLLTKASRLFTGSLSGRVIEILQNARRGGATAVEITNEAGVVTVRDNGRGIGDFARLLDLGGSDWEDGLEQSEDPAGVGLLCLAPRELLIRSRGSLACIGGDAWTGEPVVMHRDPEPIDGTFLRFRDEKWTMAVVEQQTVFSGMKVVVDGQPCAQENFVTDAATHYAELGCQIEVCAAEDVPVWHRGVQHVHGYGSHVLVNFHGQTTSIDCHPVSERGLWYLVNLTGEPTEIRLMLPARTRLVENAAFRQIKAAIELEAYTYLQRRGHHRVPYKEYVRACELGIELPEATPTFQVGLLSTAEAPAPVEVAMPEDVPLEHCFRFDPDYPDGDETDEANVHLLAALGQFDEPFVPVSIRSEYDGYGWAKLPMIDRVSVTVSQPRHTASVWSGTLSCVDELEIAVDTSDGRTISAPVCMAIAPSAEDASPWGDDHVLVTPAAQERLGPAQIWYHLGGWCDDGDTYDTQADSFAAELGCFWADLSGPDERVRQEIIAALAGLRPDWQAVTVLPQGQVYFQLQDGSTKIIRPDHVRSR